MTLNSLSTSMREKSYVLRPNAHCNSVLKALDEQRRRQDKTLCDIVLCVDGALILAHKAVLAACSSYFKQRFAEKSQMHKIEVDLRRSTPEESDKQRSLHNEESMSSSTSPPIPKRRKTNSLCLPERSPELYPLSPSSNVTLSPRSVEPAQTSLLNTEQNTTKEDVVYLPGIKSSAFSQILDYMYTAELSIKEDNIFDILLVSCLLQIRPVLSACVWVLSKEPRWKIANKKLRCNKKCSSKVWNKKHDAHKPDSKTSKHLITERKTSNLRNEGSGKEQTMTRLIESDPKRSESKNSDSLSKIQSSVFTQPKKKAVNSYAHKKLSGWESPELKQSINRLFSNSARKRSHDGTTTFKQMPSPLAHQFSIKAESLEQPDSTMNYGGKQIKLNQTKLPSNDQSHTESTIQKSEVDRTFIEKERSEDSYNNIILDLRQKSKVSSNKCINNDVTCATSTSQLLFQPSQIKIQPETQVPSHEKTNKQNVERDSLHFGISQHQPYYNSLHTVFQQKKHLSQGPKDGVQVKCEDIRPPLKQFQSFVPDLTSLQAPFSRSPPMLSGYHSNPLLMPDGYDSLSCNGIFINPQHYANFTPAQVLPTTALPVYHPCLNFTDDVKTSPNTFKIENNFDPSIRIQHSFAWTMPSETNANSKENRPLPRTNATPFSNVAAIEPRNTPCGVTTRSDPIARLSKRPPIIQKETTSLPYNVSSIKHLRKKRLMMSATSVDSGADTDSSASVDSGLAIDSHKSDNLSSRPAKDLSSKTSSVVRMVADQEPTLSSALVRCNKLYYNTSEVERKEQFVM